MIQFIANALISYIRHIEKKKKEKILAPLRCNHDAVCFLGNISPDNIHCPEYITIGDGTAFGEQIFLTAWDSFSYIQNDKELERLSVYSDIDEHTLKTCGGDALFISESNWLTMQLKDNNTGEEGEPNVLDTDNIYEPFNDCQRLLDYIWSIE